MGKLEDQILEELEKEAKEWVRKEYRKRQEIYRQEIEKQVAYAEEHDGSSGASTVRAYHERCMSLGMSELLQEVEFEADQWIIKEMAKRLEKARKKADAGTRGRGDAAKKTKTKTTAAKAPAKAGTASKPKIPAKPMEKAGSKTKS